MSVIAVRLIEPNKVRGVLVDYVDLGTKDPHDRHRTYNVRMFSNSSHNGQIDLVFQAVFTVDALEKLNLPLDDKRTQAYFATRARSLLSPGQTKIDIKSNNCSELMPKAATMGKGENTIARLLHEVNRKPYETDPVISGRPIFTDEDIYVSTDFDFSLIDDVLNFFERERYIVRAGGHVWKIHPIGTDFFREQVKQESVTLERFRTGIEVQEVTRTRDLSSKKVFIVHGHNEQYKSELARFLEKIGFEPIILHEQPSKGMTLIEKLEEYSDVGYAFILLTPDDVGGQKGKLLPRARQNVVFEFGMFVGKLGRDRVCCLYTGNVELPSDLEGLVYVQLKGSVNEVKLDIVKELRAAGYAVNI